MIGKLGHQIDGERDVLRRGSHPAAVALAVVEPDAFAGPTLGHAGTNLIDHARAVDIGYDSRIFHRRRAAPSIGVRRVDAGRFQPHADLTVTGLGRRQFAAHEDVVRSSLPVVPNRAHRRLPPFTVRVLAFFVGVAPEESVTNLCLRTRAIGSSTLSKCWIASAWPVGDAPAFMITGRVPPYGFGLARTPFSLSARRNRNHPAATTRA